MRKLFTLIAVVTVIFLQAGHAYCGVSKTMTFRLSVTIPPHVIYDTSNGTPISNYPFQLIQTQTVMRNNKSIQLTSIVVP
jgi:hypothetical protein